MANTLALGASAAKLVGSSPTLPTVIMNRKFFLFLAFITEWALLSLEMVAFKMFVPYFGDSLYIWANIIGIVMIGSSLGYFFGGRLADFSPKPILLVKIVLITSFFILLMPFFSSFLIGFLGSSNYVVLASLFYGIFLFGIPAFLIEMVPPFAVKLENKEVKTVGNSAGTIYSFSALGGICGIITSAFLTIPWLGTRETLFLAGIVLLFSGIIGLLKFKNYER